MTLLADCVFVTAWANRDAATRTIVVLFQVWSGMPRFHHPWQLSPTSCTLCLHSGKEICGRNQLVNVCGLPSAYTVPILNTPSNIATFPLKSCGWCFRKPQEPKYREHTEWSSNLHAWFCQPSRLSHRKLMTYPSFLCLEFRYDSL